MSENLDLQVLYRRVYGNTRDRIDRNYSDDDSAAIRADPLSGLGIIAPSLLANREARETIHEAMEDALAKRRPRW